MKNGYNPLIMYRKGIVNLQKHWRGIREKEMDAHASACRKAADAAYRAAEQRKEDEKVLYMAILGNGEPFPVTMGYVRQHGLI